MRIILAVFLSCFGWQISHADLRDAYTVKNIAVSEKADTVAEAQEKAFDSARVTGAQLIINRLTLSEDRARAGLRFPDPDTARLMSAAVDVQEEAAGGGVYRGVLSALMNPNFVRRFLDENDVPYVDQQAPLTLLIPVADGNAYFSWSSVLPDSEKATLTPFITDKLGRYSAQTDWAMVSDAAEYNGAKRVVIAELSGTSGAWDTRLTLLTPAGRQFLGQTGSQSRLEGLPASIIGVLENSWKRQNVVRDTGSKRAFEADVLYTSLIEWNTIRNAIQNSSLVFDFKIIIQNNTSAIVRIEHAMDTDRFERDILQRGVRINHEGGRPKITSARFGG